MGSTSKAAETNHYRAPDCSFPCLHIRSLGSKDASIRLALPSCRARGDFPDPLSSEPAQSQRERGHILENPGHPQLAAQYIAGFDEPTTRAESSKKSARFIRLD